MNESTNNKIKPIAIDNKIFNLKMKNPIINIDAINNTIFEYVNKSLFIVFKTNNTIIIDAI